VVSGRRRAGLGAIHGPNPSAGLAHQRLRRSHSLLANGRTRLVLGMGSIAGFGPAAGRTQGHSWPCPFGRFQRSKSACRFVEPDAVKRTIPAFHEHKKRPTFWGGPFLCWWRRRKNINTLIYLIYKLFNNL